MSLTSNSEFDLYDHCQKLAHRYKSTQEYGDLVSEGYIAGMEAQLEGHLEDAVRGKVRTAMSRYMGRLSTPVDVPDSGEAHKARAAIRREEDLSRYSSTLVAALCASEEPVQPNTLKSDTTTEGDYIKYQLEENLRYILYFWLTHTESYLIHRLFFEEATQAELADELGVTQQYVNLRKSEILKKLSKYLTEGKEDED
jgi:DNA-directed RNA polymerase specialized sigma subunit